MSGSTLPYQLRQNKAIERSIFIELLGRIGRHVSIQDYTYIGFGGPFLEDFKAVHAHLGIQNMISIEMNEEVLKRQGFNRPMSCIDCKPGKSDDFIRDHQFDKKTIIWLDYTAPKELSAQLNDVSFLMTKLAVWDIVKVTLNANASAVFDMRSLKSGELLFDMRLEVLKERVGSFLPAEIEDEDLSNAGYPNLLCRILENAIKNGIKGHRRAFFQSLASFVYADGQIMLTLTGIILPDDDTTIKKFFLETSIDKWSLSNLNWEKPKTISVPQLSLKERILVDEMLPEADAATIQAKLKYIVGEDEKSSIEGIENYIRYYRHLPLFSRVSF